MDIYSSKKKARHAKSGAKAQRVRKPEKTNRNTSRASKPKAPMSPAKKKSMIILVLR